MAKSPVILTPFGTYEVVIRGVNKTCDERQAAIAETATRLSDASDAVETQRSEALASAWRDYQAALKASH